MDIERTMLLPFALIFILSGITLVVYSNSPNPPILRAHQYLVPPSRSQVGLAQLPDLTQQQCYELTPPQPAGSYDQSTNHHRRFDLCPCHNRTFELCPFPYKTGPVRPPPPASCTTIPHHPKGELFMPGPSAIN